MSNEDQNVNVQEKVKVQQVRNETFLQEFNRTVGTDGKQVKGIFEVIYEITEGNGDFKIKRLYHPVIAYSYCSTCRIGNLGRWRVKGTCNIQCLGSERIPITVLYSALMSFDDGKKLLDLDQKMAQLRTSLVTVRETKNPFGEGVYYDTYLQRSTSKDDPGSRISQLWLDNSKNFRYCNIHLMDVTLLIGKFGKFDGPLIVNTDLQSKDISNAASTEQTELEDEEQE